MTAKFKRRKEIKLTRPRGRTAPSFAFVTLDEEANVDSIAETLQGLEIGGTQVKVQPAQSQGPAKKRSSRNRKGNNGLPTRRTGASDEEGGAEAEGGEASVRKVKQAVNGRPPRQPRGPPEDGTPSKDTLFVTNLPETFQNEEVCVALVY